MSVSSIANLLFCLRLAEWKPIRRLNDSQQLQESKKGNIDVDNTEKQRV